MIQQSQIFVLQILKILSLYGKNFWLERRSKSDDGFRPSAKLRHFLNWENFRASHFSVPNLLRLLWLLSFRLGWLVGCFYTKCCQNFPRNVKIEGFGWWCHQFRTRNLALWLKSSFNFQLLSSQKFLQYILKILGICRTII